MTEQENQTVDKLTVLKVNLTYSITKNGKLAVETDVDGKELLENRSFPITPAITRLADDLAHVLRNTIREIVKEEQANQKAARWFRAEQERLE